MPLSVVSYTKQRRRNTEVSELVSNADIQRVVCSNVCVNDSNQYFVVGENTFFLNLFNYREVRSLTVACTCMYVRMRNMIF